MGEERFIMVATLGFGIDFIVRRLADLPDDERIAGIIAVGLWTDPASWRRIEQTYSILTTYLKSMGVESKLEKLSTESGPLVPQARRVIAEAISESGGGKVELYLTGGPRILLASFYTAAVTLSPEWAKRIRVVVYGEGFPASLVVETDKLLVLSRLDDVSRRILLLVKEGYNEVNTLLEVTGLPRSTLYKKLRDLEDLGLIVRVGRGRLSVHSSIENII